MGAKTHFPARLENENYDFLWKEARQRGISMNALLNQFLREDQARERSLSQRSIYVMHDGHGNYKIGIAVNTKKRREHIQSSNIGSVSIVYERIIGKKAGKIERQLHEQFKVKRIRGEWFKLTADDLAQIDELISSLISPSSQNALQR